MSLARYTQYPSDNRIRSIRLVRLGTRVIASAVWTATPLGFTVGAQSETDDTASCMLGGGVSGTVYQVESVITLDNAEDITVEFEIYVLDL